MNRSRACFNLEKQGRKVALKLFTTLICLFLGPTIIVSLIFTRMIHQDVLNISGRIYADSLHQNAGYIDEYINRIRINGAMLAVNGDLRDFFLMQSAPKLYVDYKTVRNAYSELQYCVELSEGLIQNAYIYNMANHLFRSTAREYSYRTLEDCPEWESIFASEFHIFSTGDLVEAITGNRNLTLAVKSVTFNGIRRGFIALELNPATLTPLFSSASGTSGTQFFLASDTGSMVIAQNRTDIAQELIEASRSPTKEMSLKLRASGTDYLWTRHQSTALEDCSYHLFIPLKNLERDVTAHITYYSWIMYALLLLLITLSAGLASVGIYTPIIYLKKLLTGDEAQREVRSALIDKDMMSDMRQMIHDMHTDIHTASDEIADIRTENELLRGELSEKEQALVSLAVHKAFNRELLTQDEMQRLLENMPWSACRAFSTIMLSDDGEGAPLDELSAEFERLYAVESPGEACRFLCTAGYSIYYLICIAHPERWAQETSGRYQVFLEKLIEAANRSGRRVYGALGNCCLAGPDAIGESLASVQEKMHYKYMLPQPGVLADISTKEILFPIQQEMLHNFEDALRRNRLEEAMIIVRDYSRFLARQHIAPKLCHVFQQMMLYTLLNYLFAMGGNPAMVEEVYARIVSFDRSFKNYMEANAYICGKLEILSETVDGIAPRNCAMRAMCILENASEQDLRLQEIASQLGVSEAHLSRQFKATYGVNFKEYLINVKLQYAKKLLAAGNYTLKEICERIGYEDVKQFSRIFKKYEGITPHQYAEPKRE